VKHSFPSSRFKICNLCFPLPLTSRKSSVVRVNPIACRPSDTNLAHSCRTLLRLIQCVYYWKPVCL
jgi:hypothetical protein